MKKVILGLTSATLIGQALAMLALIYITQLYSQEEFGYYGAVISFAGFLSYIISARLDTYIVRLSKVKLEAVLSPVIFLVCITAIILFVVVSIIKNVEFAVAISLLSFFMFIFNLFITCSAKVGEFKKIASGRFLKPISTSGFQIILGSFSASGGLVIGAVSGLLISMLIMLPSNFLNGLKSFKQKVEITKRLLFRSSRTLIEINTQSFFSSLFHNGLIFYYSITGEFLLAGLVALLDRCLKNPIAMLGGAIRSFTISTVDIKGSLDQLKSITLFSYILFIIVFLVGAIAFEFDVFNYILGDGWIVEREFFFCYLFYSLIAMCNSVNSPYIIKKNLTSLIMKLDIVACVLFSIYLFVYTFSSKIIIEPLVVLLIIYSIYYIVSTIFIFNKVKRTDRQ